jgi:hypothetical protein
MDIMSNKNAITNVKILRQYLENAIRIGVFYEYTISCGLEKNINN